MGCITSKNVVASTIKVQPHNAETDQPNQSNSHNVSRDNNTTHNKRKENQELPPDTLNIKTPENQEETHSQKERETKKSENTLITKKKEALPDRSNFLSEVVVVNIGKKSEERANIETKKSQRFPKKENALINLAKKEERENFVSHRENVNIDDNKPVNVIIPSFKKIGVSGCDEVISEIVKLLTEAEKIRSALEDSKERCIDLTNTFLLKEVDPIELVRVFFWTISANYQGQIQKTDIKVYSEPPFLDLPQLKLKVEEVGELYQEYTKYLKAVNGGFSTVEDIQNKLNALSAKLSSFYEELKAEKCSEQVQIKHQKKLDRLERYNQKYLPIEINKVSRIPLVITQETKEIESFASQLQELLDSADEVGTKVAEEYAKHTLDGADSELENDAEYILTAGRIFKIYCKKPMKSPKEVDDYLFNKNTEKDKVLKIKAERNREDVD